MEKPQNLPPEAYVYRRVPPQQCKNGLKPRAFIPKEGEGLSVYRADMRTPRSLIEQYLRDQQQKLALEDENQRKSAEEMLARYGDTVEKVVQSGWRIARIPASVFTEAGFTLDGPEPKDHPNSGHQNVIGDTADFQIHAVTWIEQAELLTEEACLEGG